MKNIKNPQISKPLILFIVTSYSYFLSHRIPAYNAAKQYGFEVHLICEKDVSSSKKYDIIIHDFDMKRNKINPLTIFYNLVKLKKKINTINPDLIFNVALQPIFLTLMICLYKKVKIINGVMGFGVLFKHIKDRKIIYVLLKIFFKIFALKNTNYFLVQNTDDKLILKDFGINEEKVNLIKGSGVHIKNNILKKRNNEQINLGFSGRLLKIKGIELLLKSFLQINGHNKKYKLFLAGTTDPKNPTSLKQNDIKIWSKYEDITFLGFVEDIQDFWEKMDIGIFPSLYGEGIPKSMLEAVAFRCPIITSDINGCLDFSKKQKNSILVNAGNIDSITSAITFLGENYNQRTIMADNALALLKKEYSDNIIANEYLKTYKSILNQEI